MEVNSYIKEMRKKKGLTQEELAKKLGVDQGRISKWEKEELSIDFSHLPNLANILELNMFELQEKIMLDIFCPNKIEKYLKNYFIKENKKLIENNMKLLKNKNDELNEELYNLTLKLYNLIKKLIDFTFEHNLNLVETKEELFESYINSLNSLISNYDLKTEEEKYEKKDYTINTQILYVKKDFFLMILNSLIILTKKENNELHEFLYYITRKYSDYLNKTIGFTSYEYCLPKEKKLFTIAKDEYIFCSYLQEMTENISYSKSTYNEFKIKKTPKMKDNLAYLDMILYLINDGKNVCIIENPFNLFEGTLNSSSYHNNYYNKTIDLNHKYHILMGNFRYKYSILDKKIQDKLIDYIYNLETTKQYFNNKDEIKKCLNEYYH